MIVRACFLCISGMMPAGIDPVFGPVYRVCPDCHRTCLGCDGTAIFPVLGDYTLDILLNALYQLNYDVYLCHRCNGITALHPAPEVDQ